MTLPVGILAALLLAAPSGAEPAAVSTAAWAQPLSRSGLPNLHKVSEGFYRGAQPTAEGFLALRALGVKTVVNLRSRHSDQGLLAPGLAYVAIPMKAWRPKEADVVRFLRVAADPKRQPVFVHCQHGADRTGLMSAVYRVAVQGWSKEEALREMKEGGFGHHAVFMDLKDYLLGLDARKLKAKAGLAGQR